MSGNVSTSKETALAEIGYWDAEEREVILSLEECSARKRAVEDFNKRADLDEISWRQNSRQLWIQEVMETNASQPATEGGIFLLQSR